MELRYKGEALVGALMIVGVATFVGLLMWLQGKSWHSGDLVHVTFESVTGLKEGDPVRTSGVRVGNVKSIRLVSPGNVDVLFDVQHGPPPREDAKAEIVAADLFGARFIEYTPGISPRPLGPGQEVHGIRMEDLSGMATSLSGQGKDLLNNVAVLSRELGVTLVNVNRLIATLNTGASGASAQLTGSLEELRHMLQRLDNVVAQNAPVATETMRSLQQTSVRADTLMRSLARTSAAMDSLIALASHGHGAIPRLLGDSTVVNELLSTNTALRDLLADFKANPGKYIRFRL
jgi:phospholipid/cholesterol/gamma-HCH transport system substrate-binding protein